MTTTNAPATELHASRGWLIIGGSLSMLVGFMAMSLPLFFSLVIAQFLGIFALVSGVISLGLAIFGKHRAHRWLDALSGVIRIVAGIALLSCLVTSVLVLTFVLGIYLLVEGVFLAMASFSLRAHSGWFWTLISGIAAIVLGILVLNRPPNESASILGLLFGINMIFNGSALLALGLAARRPDAAA